VTEGRKKLPVVETGGAGSTPCGTKAYVTLEESTLLAAIRSVRERAEQLRAEIDAEQDATARELLRARLGQLRAERSDLVARRERAYVRKMVMLGHLPPEALESDGD
jgi:hypothetical protein